MQWVARMKNLDGSLCEKNLSPVFDNIYDCQDWINKNLSIMEFCLSNALSEMDLKVDKKLCFRSGSMIRCYNLEQDRFCDSFDF